MEMKEKNLWIFSENVSNFMNAELLSQLTKSLLDNRDVLYAKNGSKIRIKKKNRGKFTESANKAGQSVQEHARSVLNNPNATPLLKKRANFARNAAKWKH